MMSAYNKTLLTTENYSIMIHLIGKIPWLIVIILCATLGLAPFTPQPHIVEKFVLLIDGELNSFVDIFDFLLHLSPFILLLAKIILRFKR